MAQSSARNRSERIAGAGSNSGEARAKFHAGAAKWNCVWGFDRKGEALASRSCHSIGCTVDFDVVRVKEEKGSPPCGGNSGGTAGSIKLVPCSFSKEREHGTFCWIRQGRERREHG